MKIKVKDKEFSFEGYVFPINSVQRVAEQCYEQGRADVIEEFVKIFKSITSMENELVDEIAEQLKEQTNE